MQKRNIEVAVISDLHLGTYGAKAIEAVNYLQSISPRLLILNGDIIDVWQFNKHYFPPAHFAVLKEIINMMTMGTRVFYVTGNHDEMLRAYADLELGNLQLTNKLVLEINNKMIWIFHGDVFDHTTNGSAKFWGRMGSNGYAMLLAFNKLINRCAKLAGRGQVSFSKKVMSQINKYVIKVNQFENLVAELAIEKKFDYVICGHIHQPKKKEFITNKGKVIYMNSGDWVEHMTSLEYYENDWHIYEHVAVDNKPAFKKEAIINMEMIPKEVSIYLNSL